MSTKPQSPGPNSTSAASAKQARSRKALNPDATATGRAGSAGGVVLEKAAAKKPSTLASTTTPKAASTPSMDTPTKRKPRKLNKEPTSTAAAAAAAAAPSLSNEAAELEALKNRVRGLEAKVEDLYKSTPTANAAPRSPRRRGKGRKNSSATTTATLDNLGQSKPEHEPQVTELDDEEEADEELVRIESELEVARQDLAHYHPQARPRARRRGSEDTEYVEEIARDAPGANAGSDRQVTLSGSYRIPLPANLNPEDVKTIQSGVSAAQNVARSFLDQRRANQALKNAQAEAGPPLQPKNKSTRPATSTSASTKTPESSMEVGTQLEGGAGKQSWGEWIGGYSMAISRAVKTIEHEAAMEAKTERPTQSRRTSTPKAGGTGGKKKKRPAAKATMSGEQVQGLMS
ncbi:uncharacterized protein EKO05_0005295 [Ascochyta rabiei]|uniref:Uncharacterized protein n=1 Tax=Didymella rabiei TaxID=5454 RepID=A0A163G7Q1_DIDRA|nr:uncharacterized protein EKO05_0005295 [Ascochyta rabiei]KZM24727.1 hypothetical protein ST47_g4126 [Ascochyta rabiei]UPX14824.1 hypothetical protein EKO05_0005295 [Ascochyta rabiei]